MALKPSARRSSREKSPRRLLRRSSGPEGENFANLRLHHITRQAVFGNPQVQHSTGDGGRFKNGDGITPQGEVVCGRKSRRPGTDYGHALRVSNTRLLRVKLDGVARFRPVPLGDETA